MNVFLHELRVHKKNILIWNLSLFTSLVLMLLMYPAMKSEGDAYFKILASLPDELLSAFSINFETFLSFNGFFGYIYTYLLLALCVLAMNLGLSVLGKEISGKTADFIMTKPLARRSLLTEKIFAGLTMITLTNIFLGASTWIMNIFVDKENQNLSALFLILLSGFILQILFYTLGILIGIVRKRIRYITSLSLSTVFGFYILAMMSQIMKKEFLYYFTPYRYFDYNRIILDRAYELKFLILSLVLILSFTVLSYILLEKKEIHA